MGALLLDLIVQKDLCRRSLFLFVIISDKVCPYSGLYLECIYTAKGGHHALLGFQFLVSIRNFEVLIR